MSNDDAGSREDQGPVNDSLQENKPNTVGIETTETKDQSADMDETSRLRELHTDVRNQDDLERDITRQVGCIKFGRKPKTVSNPFYRLTGCSTSKRTSEILRE